MSYVLLLSSCLVQLLLWTLTLFVVVVVQRLIMQVKYMTHTKPYVLSYTSKVLSQSSNVEAIFMNIDIHSIVPRRNPANIAVNLIYSIQIYLLVKIAQLALQSVSCLTEQGDSGCCTDLYLTDYRATERTSCPIAEKCHLTVDRIPRSTGSMQCNSTEYFVDESYCTIRPDLTQKTVSKLYANSCLRAMVFYLYALCDQYQNGTYCKMPVEMT